MNLAKIYVTDLRILRRSAVFLIAALAVLESRVLDIRH